MICRVGDGNDSDNIYLDFTMLWVQRNSDSLLAEINKQSMQEAFVILFAFPQVSKKQ